MLHLLLLLLKTLKRGPNKRRLKEATTHSADGSMAAGKALFEADLEGRPARTTSAKVEREERKISGDVTSGRRLEGDGLKGGARVRRHYFFIYLWRSETRRSTKIRLCDVRKTMSVRGKEPAEF